MERFREHGYTRCGPKGDVIISTSRARAPRRRRLGMRRANLILQCRGLTTPTSAAVPAAGFDGYLTASPSRASATSRCIIRHTSCGQSAQRLAARAERAEVHWGFSARMTNRSARRRVQRYQRPRAMHRGTGRRGLQEIQEREAVQDAWVPRRTVDRMVLELHPRLTSYGAFSIKLGLGLMHKAMHAALSRVRDPRHLRTCACPRRNSYPISGDCATRNPETA
jgi:hypothetical protein